MNPAVPRFLQQLAPGARAAATVRAALPPRFGPAAPLASGREGAEPVDELALAGRDAALAPRAMPLSVTPRVDSAAGADTIAHGHEQAFVPTAAPFERSGPASPAPQAATSARVTQAAQAAQVTRIPKIEVPPMPTRAAAARARTSVAQPEVTVAREVPTAPRHDSPDAASAAQRADSSAPLAPLREATLAHHAAALRASAAAPVVHVTIDRIDVRAAPEAASPRTATRPRSAPATSLNDYLRQRAPGGRG